VDLTHTHTSTLAPMPLPILSGTHRVAVTRQPGNASTSTNVMHFFSSTLTSSQVITALNGAVKPAMFTPVHNALSTVEVVATELDGVSPTVGQSFTGGNWLGAGTGDPHFAPCIVITLKTGERGRRRTGRVFLGSISEEATTNGHVDAAILAPLQAAWTAFVADATTAGIPLHVASYGYNPVPPDPLRPSFAAASLPVLTVQVQSVLGTQRRRQSRLRG
jgi:hypothetical protein